VQDVAQCVVRIEEPEYGEDFVVLGQLGAGSGRRGCPDRVDGHDVWDDLAAIHAAVSVHPIDDRLVRRVVVAMVDVHDVVHGLEINVRDAEPDRIRRHPLPELA
jgi:hypothetical protein